MVYWCSYSNLLPSGGFALIPSQKASVPLPSLANSWSLPGGGVARRAPALPPPEEVAEECCAAVEEQANAFVPCPAPHHPRTTGGELLKHNNFPLWVASLSIHFICSFIRFFCAHRDHPSDTEIDSQRLPVPPD